MCEPAEASVIDRFGNKHHYPAAQQVLLVNYELAQCQNGIWVWITDNCNPKPELPAGGCSNPKAVVAVPC